MLNDNGEPHKELASRALVSDSNGDVSMTTITSTEIGYVNGVTSAIQTQLDAKASKGFAHCISLIRRKINGTRFKVVTKDSTTLILT